MYDVKFPEITKCIPVVFRTPTEEKDDTPALGTSTVTVLPLSFQVPLKLYACMRIVPSALKVTESSHRGDDAFGPFALAAGRSSSVHVPTTSIDDCEETATTHRARTQRNRDILRQGAPKKTKMCVAELGDTLKIFQL